MSKPALSITSAANPRIKSIAALAHKKHRQQSGLFSVEGQQLVGFGVEAGWPLHTLVLTDNTKHTAHIQSLQTAAQSTLIVPVHVMEKLTTKGNPQGVLGVFAQQPQPLPTQPNGVWVVLEQIRDPGNLGTIIRTADAAGAAGIILVGACTDVWAPECVRATMGSIFHLPVIPATLEALLAWQTQTGIPLVGTHLKATQDFRKPLTQRPLALCMGTEQSGMSEALTAACQHTVKIPMAGKAESLNLAIATGLMLYQILYPAP